MQEVARHRAITPQLRQHQERNLKDFETSVGHAAYHDPEEDVPGYG